MLIININVKEQYFLAKEVQIHQNVKSGSGDSIFTDEFLVIYIFFVKYICF